MVDLAFTEAVLEGGHEPPRSPAEAGAQAWRLWWAPRLLSRTGLGPGLRRGTARLRRGIRMIDFAFAEAVLEGRA